jgi:hypothetical protein
MTCAQALDVMIESPKQDTPVCTHNAAPDLPQRTLGVNHACPH